MRKFSFQIVFIGILCIASFFRLSGVNWDQDQHLHPDERFLTMVATAISWPKDIGQYLDSQTSPLNPHNKSFGFYVYGTYPIILTKWVAESLKLGDYSDLTIVGRQLSALVDLATVLLVYLIARKIEESRGKKPTTHNLQPTTIFPLLAMFFYSLMVLPIQLSHFFAVDPYLTFFTTLSFYICTRLITSSIKPANPTSFFMHILLGISFGLAAASKISALLFLPIIIIIYIIYAKKLNNPLRFLLHVSICILCCFFTFRIFYPYAFASNNIFELTLNPKVVDNWKQLKSFDDINGGFPPAVQWITTKPYIFPVKNLILWGLGLPLGLIVVAATCSQIIKSIRLVLKRRLSQLFNPQLFTINLAFFWILLLFGYQGVQFVKAMRYFYPIYPFLAILTGYFVSRMIVAIQRRYQLSLKIVILSYCIIVILLLVYPLSFLSFYSHLHSRVAASYWIYQHIPPGSVISGEHWDDFLPISTSEHIREIYTYVEFPLYYVDDQSKWTEMDKKLKQVDYIILTSNRLYGSIMTMPSKWPITTKFYQMLFDGSLGFEKVAEFTSRPNLPIPGIHICLTPPLIHYGTIAYKSQECPLDGISFVDDYADESFTVYDHPKVIIFKKIKPVDYLNLLYPDNAQ